MYAPPPTSLVRTVKTLLGVTLLENACILHTDKRKCQKSMLNPEQRNGKRKEKKHFRWYDEMHSSLIECLTGYKVSCEFTNTDLSSMQTFLKPHINTIKLNQTPSIKKVCLYFGGFISIYLHNFVIWRVEVAHFKTYASCLPGKGMFTHCD